jgi:acyl-CoA hydrolase
MRSQPIDCLPELLPLQSGVGNVANAVMGNLADSEFEGLTAYTEVIQDGMLDLIDSGKLASVSATAFSLSAERAADFNDRIESYKGGSCCALRRCRTIPKPSAASASSRSTEWSKPISTAT